MRGASVFAWWTMLVYDRSVAIVRHSLLALRLRCWRKCAVIPALCRDWVCTYVLHIDRNQGYLILSRYDSISLTIPRRKNKQLQTYMVQTIYSLIWYWQQWLYTICVYNILQELYKYTWLSSHCFACLHIWNIITMPSRVLHKPPW